jgi:hypothetical protein
MIPMNPMPQIFISATTADLSEVRTRLTSQVLKHRCHPAVEEGFEAVPHDTPLEDFLRNYLKVCSGMIHVVGSHYGSELPRKSSRSPRLSWTQMEYHVARKLAIPIMVCLAEPEFYGKNTPVENGSAKERKAKADLQRIHYQSFKNGSGVYYPFIKPADLDINIGSFIAQVQKRAPRTATHVLYVGAQLGTYLDLRAQFKRIRRSISVAGSSENIKITGIFDATANEIIEEINRVQPSIIHISGRQERGTIMLHDRSRKLVPFDATKLADALARVRNKSLRLVILDTCYSMQQAKRLTERGVPYAIGIYDAIADDVATDFYADFYNQLASGHDLETSLETATLLYEGSLDDKKKRMLEKDVLQMPFTPLLHIPSLSSCRGLKPSKEYFN